MALRDTFGSYGSSDKRVSNILNIVLRVLQVIFGIVVIGFYARELGADNKVRKYNDSRFGYAVAVAVLAVITAIGYAVVGIFTQYRALAILFAWDVILTILWAAVTGLFGSMYLSEGINSMRIAAIFDIINLILWGISAIIGAVVFFRQPGKSLHTGRAAV